MQSNANEVEIIRKDFPQGPFRAAIFDFDGTLSLIRRNWQDVMIPMMVEILVETGTRETREQLHQLVEDFVLRLNGRQTIYQMIHLAEEVRKRGRSPREPLEYKHQYHDLLWVEVSRRIESLQQGRVSHQEMVVPEAHDLLREISQHGVELYLASGTDLKYVRDEVELLRLGDFFGSRVYGALDDYKQFSKAMIIEQIIRDSHVAGSQLVGFGDGFVEIEEVKKVGGLAIGVASEETQRRGISTWKRERLIQAGADIIIADYRQHVRLLDLIEVER